MIETVTARYIVPTAQAVKHEDIIRYEKTAIARSISEAIVEKYAEPREIEDGLMEVKVELVIMTKDDYHKLLTGRVMKSASLEIGRETWGN